MNEPTPTRTADSLAVTLSHLAGQLATLFPSVHARLQPTLEAHRAACLAAADALRALDVPADDGAQLRHADAPTHLGDDPIEPPAPAPRKNRSTRA